MWYSMYMCTRPALDPSLTLTMSLLEVTHRAD